MAGILVVLAILAFVALGAYAACRERRLDRELAERVRSAFRRLIAKLKRS